MLIEQSFGRSIKRNDVVRQFWPAIVVFLQMLGLTLLLLQQSYEQQVEESRFLLDNVRVIVGDGTVLESAALLIEGSRITAVGSR